MAKINVFDSKILSITTLSVVMRYSLAGNMPALHDFHHLPEICCNFSISPNKNLEVKIEILLIVVFYISFMKDENYVPDFQPRIRCCCWSRC